MAEYTEGECECYISQGYKRIEIVKCSLCKSAPKLYEALKVAHRELLHAQWEDGLDQIEQALASVEGK